MKKLLSVAALIAIMSPAAWAGETDAVYSTTTGNYLAGLGIGTAAPLNKLDVSGGEAIGIGYAGIVTAPANGAIIQGSVGIGTNAPLNALDVNGTADIAQLVGRGAAPTIATGSGAGTSATLSISGTNIAGVVTLTTGTSPAASAVVATITYSGTLTAAPQGCTLSPRNAASALAAAMVYPGAPSLTAWPINVGSTALTASTAYSWSYTCE